MFGLPDGNLANYLDDGSAVRMADSEDSGRSDRAFELTEIAEHSSAWVDAARDVSALVAHFDLGTAERTRLRELRRLIALPWQVMMLPDRPQARESGGHSATPGRTAARPAGLSGSPREPS